MKNCCKKENDDANNDCGRSHRDIYPIPDVLQNIERRKGFMDKKV